MAATAFTHNPIAPAASTSAATAATTGSTRISYRSDRRTRSGTTWASRITCAPGSRTTIDALSINLIGVWLVLLTRAPELLTMHGLGLAEWVVFGLEDLSYADIAEVVGISEKQRGCSLDARPTVVASIVTVRHQLEEPHGNP